MSAAPRIAVIGAGVAGMSAAWHLHAHGFDVKVFEKKSSIGGNVRTVDVIVGNEVRWVDLGVNDFNANTYVHLTAVLDQLGVQYRPIQDTACFYTLDGSLVYTTDGPSETAAPETVERDRARFEREAPEVLTNPSYRYSSVGEYLAEKGYSNDFARYYLYPRINGMYFSDWRGAGNMPIWPVMNYFALQEGLGLHQQPKPNRMYFANGARHWIEKLYEASKAKFPILLNAEASVRASPTAVDVYAGGEVERFDKVVLALQAIDATRCVRAGLTPDVERFLASFKYRTSEVVAHTYFGALPPYVRAWRTYNILIRKNAAGPHPYTITYVVNRHQNDFLNPQYDVLGTASFFVTVNPPVPIPDCHILRQPDGAPAITVLEKMVYDMEAIRAQERRHDLQGVNNVYLAGGYARGTGLHEECWTDGMEVAALIHRVHEAARTRDNVLAGRSFAGPLVRVAAGAGRYR